jgi:hypothetical protein
MTEEVGGLHMHEVTLLVEDGRLSELEKAIAQARKIGAPNYALVRYEDGCIILKWGEAA